MCHPALEFSLRGFINLPRRKKLQFASRSSGRQCDVHYSRTAGEMTVTVVPKTGNRKTATRTISSDRRMRIRRSVLNNFSGKIRRIFRGSSLTNQEKSHLAENSLGSGKSNRHGRSFHGDTFPRVPKMPAGWIIRGR